MDSRDWNKIMFRVLISNITYQTGNLYRQGFCSCPLYSPYIQDSNNHATREPQIL